MQTPNERETPPAGLYRIDPVHSFAQFRVRHLVVGMVDGRFNTVEGEFSVTDDVEVRFERIEARLDASSIDTGVDARDEDLRSARFFEVESFPVIRYRGARSAHLDGGVGTVAGALTIRDVTREVPLDVVLRGTVFDERRGTRVGLSATTKLSRSDFDLMTELLEESGEVGAVDVDIRIDVEAVLQAPASTPI